MTSDGRVHLFRQSVNNGDFLVGAPVRATTWLEHAKLAHWVAGRGAVVVPQHVTAMIVDNTTETARYYTPGTGREMYRVWAVEIRPADPTIGASGSITGHHGGSIAYRLYRSDRDRPRVLVLVDYVGVSQNYAETETILTIVNDTTTGGSAIRVESIACWDLPRAVLDRTTADCGVALDSFFPRRPVYSDGATPQQVGIPAVAEAIHELTVTTPVRRIGHVARWGYPLVINDAGGIPLTVAPYRIVPRKDRVGATTHTVRCRVYSVGYAGDVRLVGGTAGAGSWAALSVAGWSDPAEVDIDCEDQSTADGQPSGGYDTVRIEVRTDGVSSTDVSGWCVYEFE